MTDFSELEAIYNMDFTQMRALKTPDGRHRASDEAITAFVTHLNNFFRQFRASNPSKVDLDTYRDFMTQIIVRINDAELPFFEKKYLGEGDGPELAAQKAECCRLVSIDKIPSQMQFWAASDTWGGDIRNSQAHRLAVKSLQEWSKMAEPSAVRRNRFHSNSNSEKTSSEDGASPDSKRRRIDL